MQANTKTTVITNSTAKKLTYEEKLAWYQKWQQSDLKKSAFARRENLKPNALYAWLGYVERRQRSQAHQSTTTTRIAPEQSPWLPVAINNADPPTKQSAPLAEVKIMVNQTVSLTVRLNNTQLQALLMRSLQDGIPTDE